MPGNPKRKVLIFSTAYYPFVGGAEVAIKEITDRLSEKFDFDLITVKLDNKLKSEEKVGSVRVYRIGNGNKFFGKVLVPILGALLAIRLNRKNKYLCFWAVMVSYASLAAFISNILSVLSGGLKTPIVLSLQEGDSDTHLNYGRVGLIGLSWKLALRQASYLTALSNFLLDRAQKNGYKGPSLLVPNGVDVQVFTQSISPETRQKYLKKFDKKPEEIFLVTTSRLTYKNATDDIISSLQFLPENFSLIVVGVGEDLEKLQKQTAKLGLLDRVKFLGFVHQADIPKIFSVSDIFVRPSRSEGFGNSFIEAMAFGLPVVATPVGGIVDFIDDKLTGVFCTMNSPKSIAEAVLYLQNNSFERQNIIKAAKEVVVSRYNWNDISDKMLSVFNGI